MALGNPARYPSAAASIERFAGLTADWNGHGAHPIPRASQEAAIRFLDRVWNEFGKAVPEPTVVAPTSDGGIALEWIVNDGGRERGIEIVCLPAHLEFSIRNRETGRLEEDAEATDVGYVLSNVIKRFVAGHFVLAK